MRPREASGLIPCALSPLLWGGRGWHLLKDLAMKSPPPLLHHSHLHINTPFYLDSLTIAVSLEFFKASIDHLSSSSNNHPISLLSLRKLIRRDISRPWLHFLPFCHLITPDAIGTVSPLFHETAFYPSLQELLFCSSNGELFSFLPYSLSAVFNIYSHSLFWNTSAVSLMAFLSLWCLLLLLCPISNFWSLNAREPPDVLSLSVLS